MIFVKRELIFLKKARVARLGTIDSERRVHLVPIVFANTRNELFFVIDKKKKKPSGSLKRLENITNNPNVTLLVDSYSEDWTKLAFLMIHCRAKILLPGKDAKKKRQMARILKEKYAQYRTRNNYFPGDIDEAIFVTLRPSRSVYWQNLRHSLA